MKESKEQIVKHLKQYKAEILKLLFSAFTDSLFENEELMLAVEPEEESDLLEEVGELVGKPVPFSFAHMLSQEEVELLETIDQIDSGEKKAKKAERAELLAEVMCSDPLLESFCLAFPVTEEKLEDFLRNCGCVERYRELAADPAYRKRRSYIRLLCRYAVSAVNLYGVLHVSDLMEYILEPAKGFRNKRGFQREQGSYPDTLIFSPEWMCSITVKHCLSLCSRNLIMTPDGFLVHPCFDEQVKDDVAMFIKYLAEFGPDRPEEIPQDLFYKNSNSYFRELYYTAQQKKMYLPSDTEFLKYEDPDYYEHSQAETNMRMFIKKNLNREFQAIADREGVELDELLDGVLHDFHDIASDYGLPEEWDMNEYTEFTVKYMEKAGVSMDDFNLMNQILKHAMNIANSTRLWINNGHTPNELGKIKSSKKGLTIVPGSSHAAELLEQSREDLARMGINIDLDSNAAEVPRMVFGSGLQGDMQVSSRKIYPNDPCPCGSGKKYKKCCGKAR